MTHDVKGARRIMTPSSCACGMHAQRHVEKKHGCQMAAPIAAARVGSTPRTRGKQATRTRATPSRTSAPFADSRSKTHSTPIAAIIRTAGRSATRSRSAPSFTGDAAGARQVWRPLPDTEAVRQYLLALLGDMAEQPQTEYPIGLYVDNIVVWQLGKFREARAAAPLRRIASFRPDASDAGPFGRTRAEIARLAQEALDKMDQDPV